MMDIDDEEEIEHRPRSQPLWVMFALWGLGGRSGVWVAFGISIVLALGCVAYGFKNPQFFYGAIFVFAALWYFLAIRWVDRYGSWDA